MPPNKRFHKRPTTSLVGSQCPSEHLLQICNGCRFCAPGRRRTDREHLVVPFKPNQKRRPLSPGETLLVQPVVVRGEIAVDERTYKIEFRSDLFVRRKHFVQRSLPLTWSKSNQHRERLRPPQRFPCSPLSEDGAENLRSRTLSQNTHLKSLEYVIVRIVSA